MILLGFQYICYYFVTNLNCFKISCTHQIRT
nr:MAG TPA: hypothetical protein [Caudoviricetes sp.]